MIMLNKKISLSLSLSDVLFPILFADDTSVYIEAENESLVISILNEELEKINTWLKANKLTLNLDKSHYMVFHRGKRKIDFDTPSLNHISMFIHCNLHSLISICYFFT